MQHECCYSSKIYTTLSIYENIFFLLVFLFLINICAISLCLVCTSYYTFACRLVLGFKTTTSKWCKKDSAALILYSPGLLYTDIGKLVSLQSLHPATHLPSVQISLCEKNVITLVLKRLLHLPSVCAACLDISETH